MYLDLFTHLVDHFGRLADELRCPPLYRSYFIETFERLQRWGALFDREDAAGDARAIA
jgi:hypothetical protein